MDQQKTSQVVKEETINMRTAHSPIIVAALIFFVLGTVLSVFSLINVMSFDAKTTFLESLIDNGIVQTSALTTWLVVYMAVRAVFAMFCLTFAAGLGIFVFSSLIGKSSSGKSLGLSVISSVANAVRYIWYGLCGILAVIFVIKFISYIISNINPDEGVMVIFSMIFFELICLAFFALVSYMLIKLCREITDMCDALKYIFVTGNVCDISPAAYKLLFILCGVAVLCACANSNDNMAIAAFAVSGIASVLLGIWLKKLKSQVEWVKYVNSKNKNTNK